MEVKTLTIPQPISVPDIRDKKNFPTHTRSIFNVQQGLLDLDALLADHDPYLYPHTPLWFTEAWVDYPFSPDAVCPTWEAFLAKNLEGDQERINLLQEWFGYALLPDVSQQKFLLMVGEGANGKSVICAVLTALVGKEMVSAVPLELFGERFQLTQTYGKLLNIVAEIGETDRIAEGFLKAFVSGDQITFDRKFKTPFVRRPTARLVFATNNLPQFNDKSSGIWRRMIYFPLRVQIPEGEMVRKMDQHEWWHKSGEMPGILSWAIAGLDRLRKQDGFTKPKLCVDLLTSYRNDSNPARTFLVDEVDLDPESQIQCSTLYSAYRDWSKDHGYHPLSDRTFGKEVIRCYKSVTRRQVREGVKRNWFYSGIGYQLSPS